ncbi:VOC family protein [Flavimaricola marinus]|uniref:Glyoxalase-like domain protein n=1 Tax=Flavimaricola marinus TaxID=1819565 RepID=A0A238LFT2_9RHOB|nr:VOC family protein [Flavimaricola marinus]SMY08443.1 Glyoxalase-like domain protein [Flavimaricola marinus]
MPRMIFVNLPITDLKRSRAFYTAVGFSINEQFSDEHGACVVISDSIYAMILTQEKFAGFASMPVGDASKECQHMLALSCDSKGDVDAMMEAGLANGGSEPTPARDLGFMYSRALADPDGHIWEPFWMDPAAAAEGPPDMED